MGKKRLFWALLIGFLAVSPIGSALIAGAIAERYECKVNTAGTYPCLVGDRDIGGILNTMFGMGFVSFLTLPAGIAILAAMLPSKKSSPPK